MATISGADVMLHTTKTPTLTSKTPIKPSIALPPKIPLGPVLQRVDVEPIYTALKSAVADQWPLYKESFSLYMIGQLNQEELSRRIESFICIDSSRAHLHNQLVCAVYANSQRDAPEPGVATWVSANDKPTTSAKPVSGDKAEQRLKTEIMNLPPRERLRLKALQDDGTDVYTQTVNSFHAARQMNRIPDLVPTSAGGYNKTNWEIEIQKRYTQPLFAESNEFPEPDSIQARMVPICYEEGLVQGAGQGCSDLMNVAAETCIRELLTDMFHRIRTNGPTFVQTARYKKRLLREETAYNKGMIQRDAAGLLPLEIEAAASRQPLGLNDFRLAIDLGNSTLNQLRMVSDRIMSAYRIDDEEDAHIAMARVAPIMNGVNGILKGPDIHGVNGISTAPKINGHLTNGIIHDEPEEMDWMWTGGAAIDRSSLNGVLDECLTIGQ